MLAEQQKWHPAHKNLRLATPNIFVATPLTKLALIYGDPGQTG